MFRVEWRRGDLGAKNEVLESLDYVISVQTFSAVTSEFSPALRKGVAAVAHSGRGPDDALQQNTLCCLHA